MPPIPRPSDQDKLTEALDAPAGEERVREVTRVFQHARVGPHRIVAELFEHVLAAHAAALKRIEALERRCGPQPRAAAPTLSTPTVGRKKTGRKKRAKKAQKEPTA